MKKYTVSLDFENTLLTTTNFTEAANFFNRQAHKLLEDEELWLQYADDNTLNNTLAVVTRRNSKLVREVTKGSKTMYRTFRGINPN